MYIKIAKNTKLDDTLNHAFAQIGSILKVRVDEEDLLPDFGASVENGAKFSQVYAAEDDTLLLPDFWKNGVCFAHGSATDVIQVAKAIDHWLCNDIKIKELSEQFTFVYPTVQAVFFEEGKEVKYAWNRILNDEGLKKISAVVGLAMDDEILGALFPFTSMGRLCFSRCTGYPYTSDVPLIEAAPDGTYEARLPDNTLIGRGNAVEVLSLLKLNLPADIQPAVPGTADDL